MKRDIDFNEREFSPPILFGGLMALIFLAAFGAAGSWDLRMGSLALVMGFLMIFSGRVVVVPKFVAVLAVLFLGFGLAPFLPADWFGIPAWRSGLEELGVDTGKKVVIQGKLALEQHLFFVLTLLVGLWFLGLRASSTVLRNAAFSFVIGIAVYAVVANVLGEKIPTSRNAGHFGFFPQSESCQHVSLDGVSLWGGSHLSGDSE